MKLLVGGLLLLLLVAQAQAECSIVVNGRATPDSDCDTVVDLQDNCRDVPNSDQKDSNRNMQGDACDLLIQEVTANPDNHVEQGEFAHITVRLFNSNPQPLRDITITAQNDELDIDALKMIPLIPPGEIGIAELWLKIPACAEPDRYPISITASYEEDTAFTQEQTLQLEVEGSNACGSTQGPLENSIINLLHKVDVEQGGNALIPMRVSNMNEEAVRYDFSMQDLGNFGTWRIDPRSSITLQPGKEETLYLYVQTEQGMTGNQQVSLLVSANEQKTTIPINIFVQGTAAPTEEPQHPVIQMLFIIALVALIMAAIFIAIGQRRRPTIAIEHAEERKETNY
jgi:hypothetical protein